LKAATARLFCSRGKKTQMADKSIKGSSGARSLLIFDGIGHAMAIAGGKQGKITKGLAAFVAKNCSKQLGA